MISFGFLAGSSYGYIINPPVFIDVLGKENRQEVNFSLFWEVWDILTNKYLFDEKLNAQELLWGAISGMVNSAGDPYTSFLTPKENSSIKDSLNGTYEGIGAELGMSQNDQLIVVSPLQGSPAKEAGLKAQDKIIKINDESTAGITVIEAVGKIRGESGTKVKLTIERGEKEIIDLEITRGSINYPSVELELCTVSECFKENEQPDNADIAYIRLSRFGDDTNDLWTAIANNVKSRNLDKVIIDVRGNPGGYLLSAVHIAGFFLDKGDTILWQEDIHGFTRPLNSDQKPILQDVDVVLLLDEGSASASEILAAALRDNLEARLVGKKSFGKGTVQEAQDFPDGSGLHVTTAKWLTPKKVWVHDNGLTPDEEVDFNEELYKENGTDTQLVKALEIIASSE